MIQISRDTGTVTWENFVLYPRLFHDDFVQQYPQLTAVHDIYTPDGMHERIYHFPPINLDNYPTMPRATYYDNKLSGIYIGRVDPLESDDEIIHWGKQLPGWVVVAQNWLVTQLGQPQEIQPGELYREDEFLTSEDIQLLQSWSYNFEWGSAGFYYDALQQPGDIYVRYDYHQQIRNWDELTAECEILVQNQQKQNGMYIAVTLATRSLIDILRPHFDFQELKPHVNDRGLDFRLPKLDTKVIITVHPHKLEKRYEIWRDDTTQESFIAEGDYSKLIEELRRFLETETM